MVRVDSKTRRKALHQHLKSKNKVLNQYYIYLLVVGLIFFSCALYFVLLPSATTVNKEEQQKEPEKPIDHKQEVEQEDPDKPIPEEEEEDLSDEQEEDLSDEQEGNLSVEQEKDLRDEEESIDQEKLDQSESEESGRMMAAAGVKKGAAFHVLAMKQPFLVYGTAWKKERTAEFVEQAVKAGFRFIDTACQPKHYNEAGVGNGWTKAAADLNLDRSDIFLQTKYTDVAGQDPKNIPYDKTASLEDQVKQSLAVSLRNLQTTYLDSWVMHSPQDTLEDTMRVYRTMESFVDEGKVKRLGISNCYDYAMFTSIYEHARIKPSVLQNRLYADSNFDTELRQFCKENSIWYQSFWTLTANRHALASNEVREWAAAKKLTPQTLMFAFLLQTGYITPLSGTTSLQHMKEDVEIMERIQNGEKIMESEADFRKFEELLGMS